MTKPHWLEAKPPATHTQQQDILKQVHRYNSLVLGESFMSGVKDALDLALHKSGESVWVYFSRRDVDDTARVRAEFWHKRPDDTEEAPE